MTHLTGAQLVDALDALIAKHHLLQHPFYQAWTRGELDRDTLSLYAKQYYKHVEAFPEYLRSLAARTEGELNTLVVDNLAEEENPAAPHPDLWRDFARAVGVSDADMDAEEALPGLRNLVETYAQATEKGSIAGAVACLYAYESQVPEIAGEKIAGLKEHYGVSDPAGLMYFIVHQEADVHHRAQWRGWLESQTDIDGEEVLATAERGLKALWGALDACQESRPTVH